MYDPRTGVPINNGLANFVVAVNADTPEIDVTKHSWRRPQSLPRERAGVSTAKSIAHLVIDRSGGLIFLDDTAAQGANCCVELPPLSRVRN